MKAMLLAAGRGERLRPLTDHTAKPLIEANHKPLIEYHLENLRAAAIEEVIINTCWCAEKIVEQLGDGSRFGLNIQYSHEPEALETAGGIANALHLLGGDQFLLLSADIWCDIDLAKISKPTRSLAHLIFVDNPAHNPNGDFGLADNLVKIKSGAVSNALTYSGIGIFEPSLFASLPAARFALREVLIPAIDDSQISGVRYNGNWFDIGTAQRLQALEQHLQSQP